MLINQHYAEKIALPVKLVKKIMLKFQHLS
jgi:hypothetical protein